MYNFGETPYVENMSGGILLFLRINTRQSRLQSPEAETSNYVKKFSLSKVDDENEDGYVVRQETNLMSRVTNKDWRLKSVLAFYYVSKSPLVTSIIAEKLLIVDWIKNH